MSDGIQLCFLVSIAISIGLLIYGFVLVLRKAPPHENEMQAISCQIKGFGFILLAHFVLILGLGLCMGVFGKNGGPQNLLDRLSNW